MISDACVCSSSDENGHSSVFVVGVVVVADVDVSEQDGRDVTCDVQKWMPVIMRQYMITHQEKKTQTNGGISDTTDRKM